MSAASMVVSVAGSRGWGAVVIRRLWLAVAWSSSRTASRALPEWRPASAWAKTVAALRAAPGGEGEAGLTGQGGEDGGELPGGVAGEVDDCREAGRQSRAGAQQVAERAWPPRQDHGQLTVRVIAGAGELLVQAAEQMPTTIGQLVPGVRVVDHQQVTAGAPGRVGHQRPGLLHSGPDQIRGGDLAQVPVRQQPELGVDAGDSPGRPGLARTRAAGVKTRFFHAGRVTAVPAWRRACSARSTAILPASCSLTASRPGRLAKPPMSFAPSWSSLGAPFTAVTFPSRVPNQPAARLAVLVHHGLRERMYRPSCDRFPANHRTPPPDADGGPRKPPHPSHGSHLPRKAALNRSRHGRGEFRIAAPGSCAAAAGREAAALVNRGSAGPRPMRK